MTNGGNPVNQMKGHSQNKLRIVIQALGIDLIIRNSKIGNSKTPIQYAEPKRQKKKNPKSKIPNKPASLPGGSNIGRCRVQPCENLVKPLTGRGPNARVRQRTILVCRFLSIISKDQQQTKKDHA